MAFSSLPPPPPPLHPHLPLFPGLFHNPPRTEVRHVFSLLVHRVGRVKIPMFLLLLRPSQPVACPVNNLEVICTDGDGQTNGCTRPASVCLMSFCSLVLTDCLLWWWLQMNWSSGFAIFVNGMNILGLQFARRCDDEDITNCQMKWRIVNFNVIDARGTKEGSKSGG